MSAGKHLNAALDAEADAYRTLVAGGDSAEAFRRARDAYLASHAETGPASWGRLLGALKMAILAGDGAEAIARQAVAETGDAGSTARARATSSSDPPRRRGPSASTSRMCTPDHCSR